MFPINWERLDASVFTSMLPATRRKSRTFATRETDVISERKHCSRRRRHTQVDFRTRRKCADKTQTIARKRWHGSRKRKRSNVRSTCGRLYVTKPSFTGTRRILRSLFLKLFCRWQHVKVRAHIRLRDRFRPASPTSLCTITRGNTNYRI